jgi:hypothetical protein
MDVDWQADLDRWLASFVAALGACPRIAKFR